MNCMNDLNSNPSITQRNQGFPEVFFVVVFVKRKGNIYSKVIQT